MTARILVVEDEASICDLLSVNLTHAGHEPRCVGNVLDALRAIEQELPHLVILDWMLPDRPGTELAHSLRANARTERIPILMLTARSTESDRLTGFEAGIDDYLSKPFSPRELLARVKALLRRSGSTQDDGEAPLEVGGLRLEPTTYRVTGNGQPLKPGPTEYRLLQHLMRHPDHVMSRAQLLDSVWGDQVLIEERTVDVHIRRLRVALRPTGHDRLVETVRGGGYRLLPRLPDED